MCVKKLWLKNDVQSHPFCPPILSDRNKKVILRPRYKNLPYQLIFGLKMGCVILAEMLVLINTAWRDFKLITGPSFDCNSNKLHKARTARVNGKGNFKIFKTEIPFPQLESILTQHSALSQGAMQCRVLDTHYSQVCNDLYWPCTSLLSQHVTTFFHGLSSAAGCTMGSGFIRIPNPPGLSQSL